MVWFILTNLRKIQGNRAFYCGYKKQVISPCRFCQNMRAGYRVAILMRYAAKTGTDEPVQNEQIVKRCAGKAFRRLFLENAV